MGRRPLPPEMKAAHGTVKTRKSKVARRAEERVAAAAVIAEIPVGTQVEPPAMLRAPHFAKALEVWNELGPELERTNRLQKLHRQAFAMFCIYLGEWQTACEDLAVNGRSQHVPTIAKGVDGVAGSMERDRPAVRWRAEAYAAALEAARQFGLTPREEYALFKDQSVVARENPGLFGGSRPAAAAQGDEPVSRGPSSVGSAAAMKSAGPPVH